MKRLIEEITEEEWVILRMLHLWAKAGPYKQSQEMNRICAWLFDRLDDSLILEAGKAIGAAANTRN